MLTPTNLNLLQGAELASLPLCLHTTQLTVVSGPVVHILSTYRHVRANDLNQFHL